MNILEIEDMVKGLPDDRLQQEAEMPTGQVPQFLVVSEIQRRADMRKRFSERQQEQPQGTVKDQIVQSGIAAMAPPEPQMQAAMMGGPQPMPPQMPMQPEGPMPPQMPMAPQGPMPPQGMAEGGVVRMAEGLTTPYFEAIKGYRGEVMPLRQQLAKLTDRGASAAERESLEDQIYSMYQDYGLDQYSVDEKRAGLSEATSPEDIRRAYDFLGLNPNRYADIVGSIGTYAGEGEDNQDVNLPTVTTPIAQEEPSDETRAFIRGEMHTRSDPEGQFVASVDGPGTRDASSLIPGLESAASAPIDQESTTPERVQRMRRDVANAQLNFLRRGDVQYDEEGRERFGIDPTRPRARDIPELTVVGQRLKADEDQLSGAVKTDAKRGLSTGTAFDPEVIRLATAPDSSGGLYSVLGQDLTAMSVQGEKAVRGGDASVQGPTGRQSDRTGRRLLAPFFTSIDDSRRVELENLVENNIDASNLTPLARRVLADPEGGSVSDMPLDVPIDSSRRTDVSDVVPSQDLPISGINRDLISQLIRDPESVDFGTSLYKDAIRTAETTGTQKKGSTSGKILAPIEGRTPEEIAESIYSYEPPIISYGGPRGARPDSRYETRAELFRRVFGEDAPDSETDAARAAASNAFNAALPGRGARPRFINYALSSGALNQYLPGSGNVAEVTRGEVVQDDISQVDANADSSVVAADSSVVATDAGLGGSINNELLQGLIRGGTAVDSGATVDQIDSDSADQISFGPDNNFITGGASEKYQEFISELERRDKALADRIRDQKAPSLDYSGLISESQARLDQQLEAIKSEKGAQALIALGAGIARGDLGAGLSDAGKAVAASNAQKRALQARQQALEAGLKKSQVDAVFQQAIRQEENQIKAEEMALRAFEREGVRTRDAEKFVMDFSLKVNQLKAQIKRWDALTEENKQRLRGQILSYVQSGLSGQFFPATDPDARQRATNELIKQAAAIIGVNPTELGVAPSDTATGETTTAGKYSYKQVSE